MEIDRQIDIRAHMHTGESFSSGQLWKIPVYVTVLFRDILFSYIVNSSCLDAVTAI